MDTFYTVEEKYLQAVDELSYGETPKALRLLNEIIASDANYARAHYQLDLVYFYRMEDYQTAGYHLKLCIEIEPEFPDVYEHYLRLVVFLNMEKQVHPVANDALTKPGINAALINDLLGLHAEKNKRWDKALYHYRIALLHAILKSDVDDITESLARVKNKQLQLSKYNYSLS